MLKAVIFDFDGTIIDTETFEYNVWKEIYAEYGQILKIDFWSQFVGTAWGAFCPAKHLHDLCGNIINIKMLKEEGKKKFIERISVAPLRPGIIELLEILPSMSIKSAIATSAPLHWIKYHLECRNLFSKFDYISTADDVVNVKPSPEIYNNLLAKMRLSPDEVITIEDSTNGIKSAKATGIFCISIPNDITKNLDHSEADLFFNTANEINLKDLINRF
jgi:HAD superfamily hydrolase (TIGR01509 family)